MPVFTSGKAVSVYVLWLQSFKMRGQGDPSFRISALCFVSDSLLLGSSSKAIGLRS